MATAAHTLWSLPIVKAWLRVSADETSKDTEISQIADGVSALIETKRHEHFVSRPYTELLSGTGNGRLLLQHAPITTFTSLAIVNTLGEAAEAETLFDVDLNTGILARRSGVFPVGLSNVTAVYTAGYGAQDAATLPRDVYIAGLDLVKLIWDSKDSGAIAASSVSVGNSGTFVVRQDWPMHIRRMLESGRYF